jgi:hypothetical protein
MSPKMRKVRAITAPGPRCYFAAARKDAARQRESGSTYPSATSREAEIVDPPFIVENNINEGRTRTAWRILSDRIGTQSEPGGNPLSRADGRRCRLRKFPQSTANRRKIKQVTCCAANSSCAANRCQARCSDRHGVPTDTARLPL